MSLFSLPSLIVREARFPKDALRKLIWSDFMAVCREKLKLEKV